MSIGSQPYSRIEAERGFSLGNDDAGVRGRIRARANPGREGKGHVSGEGEVRRGDGVIIDAIEAQGGAASAFYPLSADDRRVVAVARVVLSGSAVSLVERVACERICLGMSSKAEEN